MPASKHFNPKRMRFRDMEQNFRAQFHMPKRVNCECGSGEEGRPPVGLVTRGRGQQRVWSTESAVVRGCSHQKVE